MSQCSTETKEAFLHAASKYGSMEKVHRMLEEQPEMVVSELLEYKGTDQDNWPNTRNFGFTALHVAAEDEMKDIVEYLLQRGANPNLKNCYGHTALGCTVWEMAKAHVDCDTVLCDASFCAGDCRCQRFGAIANCLLEHPDIDVNFRYASEQNGWGCTPLDEVCRCGNIHLAQKIIQCGARVTAIDPFGQSALHCVLYLFGNLNGPWDANGNHEQQRDKILTFVGFLLRHPDIDVNFRDKNGHAPLVNASAWPEAARLLIQHGARVTGIDEYYGRSLLHRSMQLIKYYQEPIAFIDEILSHEQIDINGADRYGNTALHCLCSNRNFENIAKTVEVLDHLIKNDAETDLVNTSQNTALHLLCHDCYGTDCEGGFLAIEILLQHMTADSINARNQEGFTPLHLAIDRGFTKCAMQLLEHNSIVDVNARTKVESWTPLHMACKRGTLGRDSVDLVETLVKMGADMNAQDLQGNTPLHLCTSHSTDVTACLLKQEGVHLNACNKRGLTPLHAAILGSSDRCAMMLLDCKGISVNAKRFLRTPLHMACSGNKPDLIKTLIVKGASINASDSYGNTPLHLTCSRNCWESTEYLLNQEGINIHARNHEGLTPFMLAVQCSVQSELELKSHLDFLFQFMLHTGGAHHSTTTNKKRRRSTSDDEATT